jgi:hypothetical protein
VVGAEAAEEMGIGDDSCGAGEGARPRRETEQELGALHLKRRKGGLT